MLVRILLAAGLLWLGAGASLQAQSVTAILVGTVTDQSGAAVPKANLTLTTLGTNVKRTVVTNDNGDFTIPGLAPGTYQLIAAHQGFKQSIVERVELLVNQTARLDVVLQVGAVAESVEVTGASPLVASETSSLGQVINTNQIEDLPLKGRAVFNLALLSPATAPAAPTSYAGGQRPMPGGLGSPVFSAGGGRDNANGYLVDGIEAVDPHYMTPSMFPPMDSMQEFKIQMNSYSAEFGRYSVQVNATTKSGANAFHGTLHEFFRNDDLDAANFFTNFAGLKKSPLRYNLFGGAVGGRILRNRSFFFVAYEGARIRNGSTGQGNVPTPAQWGGDFSRLGFRNNLPIFDPSTTVPNPSGSGFVRSPFPNNMVPASSITAFAKGIQNIYPVPQFESATGNNYFLPLSNVSDNNQLTYRIDHYFSPATSVSFRYNIFTGLQTGHVGLPFSGRETTVHNQNIALSIPHTFSPNTMGELRLGYSRPNYFLLQEGAFGKNFGEALGLKNLLRDPKAFGVPSLGISGFSGIGDGTEPNGQLFNIYMLISQFTLIRGPHTIKFGGEGRKTNYNDRGEIDARGAFTFTGAMTQNPQARNTTGVSVADLLLGLPLTALGESTSLSGNFNSFGYYGFVQDDWKVSPRLTLNLGLRYEFNTRYTEVQGRYSYFDRQFPGGRLLLAGTNKAFIVPNLIVPGPDTPRGLYPANMRDFGPRIGLAFRPFGGNRTAIRAGYGVFYSMVDGQATRQLERNPPNGQIISLNADQNQNSSAPGTLTVTNLFPLAGTPASQPSIYSDIAARGDPAIQQWSFSVQRQVFSDVLLEIGYMGSHGVHQVYYSQGNQARLDLNPASPTPILNRRPFPLWGSSMRTTGGDGTTSYHGAYVKLEKRFSSGLSFLTHYTLGKALDYSSQVNETTRNFYDPPSSKGRSLFDIRSRAVLSATYELPVGKGKRFLSSGGVVSQILGNWQINTIVNLHSGFAYFVTVSGDSCNCGASAQTANQVGDPRSGFEQSRTKWFNTAAFAIPANGTFGNSGRNILSGPAQANVDISLFKIVRIGENVRLQIRPEFFNALNRVNFGLPGSTVASPTYGVITSASDARVIQLALRLAF